MSIPTTQRDKSLAILALALCLLSLVIFVQPSLGVPSGATVTPQSTDNGPTISATALTNNRSTITTLILDAVQQDQQWKGYVGNVTGVLTLRDSDNYAIYEWPLSGTTITGEVYATRTNSINWLNVGCANGTTITAEETFHNMTSGSVDSLNQTFNYSTHAPMQVGALGIAQSSCQTTYTYINDTPQAAAIDATFQELLLQDDAANMIFATFIEDNENGFNNNATVSKTYDFQMIVPESDVKASATSYYFFTEIGS